MASHAQPGKSGPKHVDWPAARAEYVNNVALTYDDIASKYGVHPANVRQRACRENWTAERAERTAKLLQIVTTKAVFDAAAELLEYNQEDLKLAKSMRALVAKQMQKVQDQDADPKDLRALAGAAESAQRIARLALGASTANTDNRNTDVVAVERMTPDQRREHIRNLYQQFEQEEASVQ